MQDRDGFQMIGYLVVRSCIYLLFTASSISVYSFAFVVNAMRFDGNHFGHVKV